MSLSLDPEIATALGALFGNNPLPAPAAVGDVTTRRESMNNFMDFVVSQSPPLPPLHTQDFHVPTPDGHQLLLRWFAPSPTPPPTPGPAILYLHGGGMIALTLAHYTRLISTLVHAAGVPMLAVDYRLAPEVRAPVPVTDAYAALSHLRSHASPLGVDPARIAVMGDSAGGGLAASLAHLVKRRGDAGPPIARQILLYPMLDDRTAGRADPLLERFAVWTDADNQTGWGALLGKERLGAEEVTVIEAAGRMTVEEARGLPPAYIDVGELDLFREENLEYARKLGRAGVPCELHVWPGVPHAFEGLAPQARISALAMEQRVRVMRSI